MIAHGFAWLPVGAQNPVMRSDDSALWTAVSSHLKRSGMTQKDALRVTGLPRATMTNLRRGSTRAQDKTLARLTKLGIPLSELQQARLVDDQARDQVGSWPPAVYRLASTAVRLSDDDRQLLLRMTEVFVEHRERS